MRQEIGAQRSILEHHLRRIHIDQIVEQCKWSGATGATRWKPYERHLKALYQDQADPKAS